MEETTPGIMTTGTSAWIVVETRKRRRRVGETQNIVVPADPESVSMRSYSPLGACLSEWWGLVIRD
jgi:hypothetical protein